MLKLVQAKHNIWKHVPIITGSMSHGKEAGWRKNTTIVESWLNRDQALRGFQQQKASTNKAAWGLCRFLGLVLFPTRHQFQVFLSTFDQIWPKNAKYAPSPSTPPSNKWKNKATWADLHCRYLSSEHKPPSPTRLSPGRATAGGWLPQICALKLTD